MKAKNLFLFLLFSFAALSVNAQNISVSGQVTDAETGEPVIAAIVIQSGTTHAVSTDLDGRYTIQVPASATLEFNIIGYEVVTIPVNGKTTIDVALRVSQNFLDEVVVSALGIKREAKALTYASQSVKASEFSGNKSLNMMTSLAGKAAGVQVSGSAAGLGGSTKLSIRGFRSIAGNNEPLYIINGVPMGNDSSVGSDFYGRSGTASYDRGDGIANLNSDDIESITILKGASASALYGTQAANGVILITTKSGSTGKMHVTFNNSTTFEKAAVLPDLQRTYGLSSGYQSWGNKLASPATLAVDDFFRTATTMVNSIALEGGTERSQTYVSYSNTTANGLLENSNMYRHNISVRNTTHITKDLTLDTSIQLIKQHVLNRPTPGGLYHNPIIGVYRFPVGEDFSQWKEYSEYDPERNLNVQRWNKVIDAHSDQNPYWLMNRALSTVDRERLLASATLKWEVNPHFNIQGRASVDYSADNRDTRYYASTSPAIIKSTNGLYKYGISHGGSFYTDVLANYRNEWGDFGLNATIGGSWNAERDHSFSFDSRDGGMKYANIFVFNNLLDAAGDEGAYQKDLAAIFGTASVSYKDYLFLDLTARNDWSSTLAYTESFKRGFFYPSVGVSFLASEAFNLPKFIDFAKVRASYSVVGNDLPSRVTNPLSSLDYTGSVEANTTAPFGDLKPELSSSFEVGADIRLFNSRVNFDFTWYKTNTTNQIFELPAPSGSGYATYYANAGNIENKGIELTIGLIPVETRNVVWHSNFNISHNTNKIISLHEDLHEFIVGSNGSFGYMMKLVEGGSYGDFYVHTFARDDNGKLLLDKDGLPYAGDTVGYGGNNQPKWNIGWNNSIEICKNLSVSFLIDARLGGQVLSLTQADLDAWGVTSTTARDRDRGYAEMEGIKFNDVKAFYDRVANYDGLTEHYIYDATNIRLREASIGYTLPQKWFDKCKWISSVSCSVVGRNLLYFYLNSPYDPDALMDVGTDLQGVDFFGMPTTRSFGFNVNVKF